MELQQYRRDGIMIVAVKGRLDAVTSVDFEKELMGLIQSGEASLILDFAGLDYISSAGLRVLLKAAKESKSRKGRISLCNTRDYIREILEMSGFLSFFPVFASLDEALTKA